MSVATFGRAFDLVQLRRRNRFAWTLLAALGLWAALAGPFFTGNSYLGDDLGAFHLPLRTFYANCLARGEAFDWMPHLYRGFYLTGEGQVGAYHPLHLALYRTLSVPVALAWEVLLSYPLMLVGGYLWLRRWALPRDAALLASLVFTFSGFNLLHLVHVNAVAIVAHLPWLLWAVDVIVRDAAARRAVGGWAILVLLVASQLLLGYPQYVWYSALAVAIYCLVIIVGDAKARLSGDVGSSLIALATATLVGLLIGSVQLLPTLDALSESTRRAGDAQFAAIGSMHPLNLVQLVAPYSFANRVVGQNTHELGIYAGAAPLLLAALALSQWKRLGRLRWLAGFAVMLAGVAVVLALGKYGPLHALIVDLPWVGRFRFPVRAIVLAHLAIAALAAVGFRQLTRPSRNDAIAHSGRLAMWSLVAASIVAAVLVPLAWPQQVASWWLIAAGPLLFAASAALIWLVRRQVAWAASALIVLTAIDLGLYGLSDSVYPQAQSIESYVARLPAPPEAGQGCVVAEEIDVPGRPRTIDNRLLLAGVQRLGGYSGLEPHRVLDYHQLDSQRAAGVQWVLTSSAPLLDTQTLPGADRVANSPATTWRPISNPLPLARLVTHASVSGDPQADLAAIDLQSTALVDRELHLDGGPAGAVIVREEAPSRLVLKTTAPSDQLLVLTWRWHDGWQATVDGQPAEVLRVNGDFLGCPVPAGTHDVAFYFAPRSLRAGKLLSLCGLGLLLLGTTVGLLRVCSTNTCAKRP